MENKATFTGEDKKNWYEQPCPRCDGKGYIHCGTCGEHTKCPACGGTGKANVYGGGIYKVWWKNPNTTSEEYPTITVSFTAKNDE